MVRKPIRASGARKSLRIQSKLPVSLIPQATLAKASSSPLAPISQLPPTKRKRSRDSEAEADEPAEQDRPAKQSRVITPSSLEPSKEKLPNESEAGARADGPEGASGQPQGPPLLSEKDSQSLKSVYENVMHHESDNSRKRTSSLLSTAPSGAGSDQTQRSSISNATYRRQILAAVNIHFHVKPPDAVETIIRDIINAESSEQCGIKLGLVAKEFQDGCLKNVRVQAGEDDFLDPLYTAIKALGLKKICIREKAAWRSELKPIVQQQQRWSSSFMTGIQQREVDDASAPLPKRQNQHNNNCISPVSLMTRAITPSANNSQESIVKPPLVRAPEGRHRSPVKTPHPDLSIGIDLDTLISTLSPVLGDGAAMFIDWLQKEMVQHELDGPFEPMLIPIPASRAGDLAFPFAVIECKAYSTGKQIFEAENQAAVSMACAHNILHRLDRMANDGTTASTQTRVLFSITTEGPIHELWAHWTVVKGGIRMFESKLWDSWNGLVELHALDFIVKLHSLCVWGTGPFMESVVGGLKRVATQADTLSSR